jgi:hypothetical protein
MKIPAPIFRNPDVPKLIGSRRSPYAWSLYAWRRTPSEILAGWRAATKIFLMKFRSGRAIVDGLEASMYG